MRKPRRTQPASRRRHKMRVRPRLEPAVQKVRWTTRVKWYLWKIGLLELPFWEQPEVPMLRGPILRAALERGKGE